MGAVCSSAVSPRQAAKHDFFCWPCNEDDIHTKATGVCLNCQELLCGNCIKVHKAAKIYVNHELKDRTRILYKYAETFTGINRDNASPRLTSETSCEKPLPNLTEDPMQLKAEHLYNIKVKSNSDENDCDMYAIAVLGDKLIICDAGNEIVKLVDLNARNIIHEIEPQTMPCDVASICQHKAAVTLPEERIIIFLKVTNKLTIYRAILFRDRCKSIAYNGNRLIVTFVEPGKIEIMKLDGTVERKIEKDNGGNPFFAYPVGVRVSTDGSILYVQDTLDECLKVFSRDGTLISRSETFTLLSNPVVDHHGRVMVCHEDKNAVDANCKAVENGDYEAMDRGWMRVVMLTSDYKSVATILVKDLMETLSLGFCPKTCRLYVGQTGTEILVYQIS